MQQLELDGTDLLNFFRTSMQRLWEIQLETGVIKIWYDATFPALEGKKLGYDAFCKEKMAPKIFPADRALFEKQASLPALKEIAAGEKQQQSFDLRLLGKPFGFEWHETFYFPSGESRIFLTSRIVTEYRRTQAVAAALHKEYDYIIYIEARKNSYMLYLANHPGGRVPPTYSQDYETEMVRFNRQYVAAKEQDFVIAEMRLQRVLHVLDRKGEHVVYCTAFEKDGKQRQKKLRFSFLNADERILLLTRTDVTEFWQQQEKRKAAEIKLKESTMKKQAELLQYLEGMPAAFCVVRVDLDENGAPCDFVLTYVNEEHASLEGRTKDQLLFQSFYDVFPDGDKKWLKIYYETAYTGVRQQFTDFSPEIGRYLSISTYQPLYGYCGCILRDVTKDVMMEIEVEKSRERDALLLRNTTDAVFQYDLAKRVIYSQAGTVARHKVLPKVEDVPYGLLRHQLILEDGIAPLQDVIDEIENGAKESSCEIMARLTPYSDFSWYSVTLSAYREVHTGKRSVIGFLKNINSIVLQRRFLEKAASMDSLTQLYNVATGRMLVENALVEQKQQELKNAFFMLDLDDFKQINDRHGHAFGDLVLQQFADALKKVFSDKYIVFRLGGDEFAVFVPKIGSMEDANQFCKALFCELDDISRTGIAISVSIGAFIGDAFHSYEEYYKKADSLLYQVKGQGKRSYRVGGETRAYQTIEP